MMTKKTKGSHYYKKVNKYSIWIRDQTLLKHHPCASHVFYGYYE